MFHDHNSRERYGSARFADYHDIAQAGFFKQSGLPAGFYNGNSLHFDISSPFICIGGSGAGKLSSLLGRIVCTSPERQFIVCIKGELTSISLDSQIQMGKAHYCINPFEMHNLPSLKVNPFDILTAESKTLTADCKHLTKSIIVDSGSKESYFEDKAREYTAKLLEWQVLKYGKTNLVQFYTLLNAINGDIKTWANAIEDGEQSNRVDIKRTFCEMKDKQVNVPKEFSAIISTIYGAFDFLSDPNLLNIVGGDSDFSLSAMCGAQNCNVSLILPAETLASLAPFVRLCIGVTNLYKSRSPASPKIVFVVDEAAQLGRFQMLEDMMVFGRGIGCIVFPIFQSAGQLSENFGQGGLQTFIGSAGTRIFMGVREMASARMASEMLGNQTLKFKDHIRMEKAKRHKMRAVQAILDEEDLFNSYLDVQLQNETYSHPNKQQRRLMEPSEILNMHNDMLIFTDKAPPCLAQKIPYFECYDMAGKYFENIYHNTYGQVSIMTRKGKVKRRILEKEPSYYIRDFPQYKTGRLHRYVEGFPTQTVPPIGKPFSYV